MTLEIVTGENVPHDRSRRFRRRRRRRKQSGRVFLVVVDESPELKVALRYACRRAQKTGGRVALLHVTEPAISSNASASAS